MSVKKGKSFLCFMALEEGIEGERVCEFSVWRERKEKNPRT